MRSPLGGYQAIAFILQGGRDYQVTVHDDLVRWRAGLGQHVDPNVIADIAQWLAPRPHRIPVFRRG